MSATKTHVLRFRPRPNRVHIGHGVSLDPRPNALTVCGREIPVDETVPRSDATCKTCTRRTVRMRRAGP